MTPPNSPFAHLPTELVYRILELAATACPHACAAISLASKRTRQAILPILFRTLALSAYCPSAPLCAALYAGGAFTPGAHVRNLAISDNILDVGMAAEVLAQCPRVERLLIDDTMPLSCRRSVNWPAPWEIMFTTPYHIGAWFAHPILRHVTHLHVSYLSREHGVAACLSLPRLTHFSLQCEQNVIDDVFETLIRRLLDVLSRLEMLLLHADGAELGGAHWVRVARIGDQRLYGRPYVTYRRLCESLKGGLTVWQDAKVNYADWRELVRGRG